MDAPADRDLEVPARVERLGNSHGGRFATDTAMNLNARAISVALVLALLIGALSTQRAEAKEMRYLTGNSADVKSKLHGPAYHLQGGGGDVAAAMQWMIDQVRGCTDCPAKLDVVVLRSSGEDGYNDFVYKMNGVDSVETLVIKDRADSNSAAVRETVRNAEIVFFAGGDQCNYVRYFKGTEVERGVEHVHARGGGVGGTSAGLAIQGDVAYDACSGGSARTPQSLRNPYHADISFTDDFFDWPVLRGTITDTHFVERDRMGRLLAFIARQLVDGKYERILGVAVERETSLVVDERGLGRVLGKGPVYFVLGDHRPEVCAPGAPLTYSDYKIWKRASGETFDLKRRPKNGYYLVSVKEGKILSDPY
ncbi:MAG: cyanophycinase [Pyrinomonadaceae bacterium]